MRCKSNAIIRFSFNFYPEIPKHMTNISVYCRFMANFLSIYHLYLSYICRYSNSKIFGNSNCKKEHCKFKKNIFHIYMNASTKYALLFRPENINSQHFDDVFQLLVVEKSSNKLEINN